VIPHIVGFVSVHDIGDSLRESFFMFWETLWAHGSVPWSSSEAWD